METQDASTSATTVAKTPLHYLRRNRGWTQHYLAELIGVTRAYVAQVEAGTERPSARFRAACTHLFDTPEDVLFPGESS